MSVSGLGNKSSIRDLPIARAFRPAQNSEARIHTRTSLVSIWPVEAAENRFIGLFSRAISAQGYRVRPFRWGNLGLRKADFAFLHWPDDFFATKERFGLARPLVKLAIICTAKMLWGTRFIWVAHNAMPHDPGGQTPLARHWFLRSLAGVVFLSEHSRVFVNSLYPELRSCKTLVTVHGHYRDAAATPATPAPTPATDISLITFGQIRRYKNIERLVDVAVSIPSGIRLRVTGLAADRSLCASIAQKARAASHITFDCREVPIPEAELEAMIDLADAVVMPYKNVLNSGSALLALSRNRPILAPNMGSLPELREQIGSDWIYLYDGDFSRQVLVDFRTWMLTTQRGRAAPLDAYDFTRVGRDLSRFIEGLGR